MATKVQVVFDCADPDRQARFWAEALHYVLQPPPPGSESWDAWAESMGIPAEARNDFSAILDPGGVGPRIFFQRVPEPKVAKNRVHLDLNAGGGRDVSDEDRRRNIDAEVVRLTALGATDDRGAKDERGEYWVRMNDPEGNEFCVQ